MNFSRYWLVFAALLLLVPAAFAQEEATAEVTPEVEETTEAVSTEPIETAVGPITVTHPANWVAFDDSNIIVVAETTGSGEIADIADNAIVLQVQLIGIPRITNLDEPSAPGVMNALLESIGGTPPEVVEVELDNFMIARADLSNPEVDTIGYVAFFNDSSFGILTAGTNEPGRLVDSEETVLDIINSIGINVEAPFTENEALNYTDFDQGTSVLGFPRLGDADAPVQIVEISSFDCPACRQFKNRVLPEILPRVAAGEAQFIYQPIFGTGGIPLGDGAARASVCMIPSDNFWTYHDAVFEWQDFGAFAYVYERLEAGAVELGVDAQEFRECFASDETSALLQLSIEQIQTTLGQAFQGTPTVVVNGIPVPATADAINAAVDAALEEAEGMNQEEDSEATEEAEEE